MKVLAQYMTGKQNPQFAKALANRVWSWLFGRGVVQPVDDFRERGNAPLSKGLLETLGREFSTNKYSIKHLVRTICASDAYQRSCHSSAPYAKVDFSRGSVKQLNGEQLMNALRVATGGLASVVAPLSSSIERCDPDLTLRGLRLAARHLGLEW